MATIFTLAEAQKETEKEGEPDEISSQVDEDPSEKGMEYSIVFSLQT